MIRQLHNLQSDYPDKSGTHLTGPLLKREMVHIVPLMARLTHRAGKYNSAEILEKQKKKKSNLMNS